jgi:translation initiation factor 6 (eIF-6)
MSLSRMDLSVESEEVIYTGLGTVVIIPTGSNNVHCGQRHVITNKGGLGIPYPSWL